MGLSSYSSTHYCQIHCYVFIKQLHSYYDVFTTVISVLFHMVSVVGSWTAWLLLYYTIVLLYFTSGPPEWRIMLLLLLKKCPVVFRRTRRGCRRMVRRRGCQRSTWPMTNYSLWDLHRWVMGVSTKCITHILIEFMYKILMFKVRSLYDHVRSYKTWGQSFS